jgi:hypothetical protein
MATSEVAKYSVYDPRVIQTKPKYAVEKGALSLTNVTFNSQTANSTAQQFNVIVPSENVFIDRAVEWISGGVITFNVSIPASGASNTIQGGQPLMVPGRDIAFAAFPSHQCVSQMTATINDATVTVNTQDVLNQVLRLQDLAKHRRQRTCPTMLDTYAYYPDTTQVTNSPLNGYGVRQHSDESPNGAWSQWWFCDSTGAPLNTGAIAVVTNYGSGSQYSAEYGLPCIPAAGIAGSTTATTYQLFVRWQSSEHLLLPPFIFGDAHEMSTGLFGVQNFQVQMNMAASPSRAVRISSRFPNSLLNRFVTASTQATTGVSPSVTTLPTWATTVGGSYPPYPLQPALSVQFLTPALDVPLPPKSIVPYMEFPRYITTGIPAVSSTLFEVPTSAKGVTGNSTTLQTNTITLPNIPDLLMIYAKPAVAGQVLSGSALYPNQTTIGGSYVWDSTIGDFTLPIQAVSINFDNFSGLLANHTQWQLYRMSVNNGLDMDFAQWSGIARQGTRLLGGTSAYIRQGTAAAAGATVADLITNLNAGAIASLQSELGNVQSALNVGAAVTGDASGYISTVGGPLVLRPGRDFALQAGQAPGLVGNFTLQVNLTVGNQFAQALSSGAVNLYVVPISSGFFETIKGSSRIIKGVLTEQDILGSPAHAPSEELVRHVGAGKGGRSGHRKGMDEYC